MALQDSIKQIEKNLKPLFDKVGQSFAQQKFILPLPNPQNPFQSATNKQAADMFSNFFEQAKTKYKPIIDTFSIAANQMNSQARKDMDLMNKYQRQGIYGMPLRSQTAKPIEDLKKSGWLGNLVGSFMSPNEEEMSIARKIESGQSITPQERSFADQQTLDMVAGISTPLKAVSKAGVVAKETGALSKGIKMLRGMFNETLPQTNARRAAGVSLEQAYAGAGEVIGDFKQAFNTWVNTRAASKIEGVAKAREFAELDNQGLQGIFKVQAGKLSGTLRSFFDDAYNRLRGAGIEVGYQKNYLPQLWNNTEEEVTKAFGRTLNTKPSFTIEKVIENYQKGISLGLNPKYETISDLAGWYEQRVNKTIADSNFFKFLKDQDLIKPAKNAPHGWVSLDPDRFPTFATKLEDGTQYVGHFKADPQLANMINNYLREPNATLAGIANYASRIKNIALSAGIPTTGWNAHGINILARNTLASKNPITGFAKAAYYLTFPKQAVKGVDLGLGSQAVKHGLTMTTEDHAFGVVEQASKKGLLREIGGKLSQVQQDLLEKPLFNQVLPALKLQHYDDIVRDLVKSGKSPDEAGRIAAQTVNNLFGGMNLDVLGRDKTLQTILRSTILAPDWAEGQIRTGAGIVKGILHPKSPEYAVYRRVMRNLGLIYLGMTTTNKLTSGHFMHENDAGHTFEVELGVTHDGKKRYIRPLGTAADFVRIPYDIALGLAKGDPTPAFRAISNRLSIPLGVGLGLLLNTDYLGNSIYGKDKYGNEMTPGQSAVGVAGQLSRLVTPPYVKAGIDLAGGRINPEQFVTQALELPFRYSNQVYGDKNQAQYQAMLQSGYTPAQAVQVLNDERSASRERSEIKKQFEARSQNGVTKSASSSAVHKYLGTDELLQMDRSNIYTQAIFKEEAYKKVSEIMEDENLTEAEKTQVLKELGIVTPEYYYIAAQSEAVRIAWIMQNIQGKTGNDLIRFLTQQRKYENGKVILSSAVIDNLVDQGIIPEGLGTSLKRLTIGEDGKRNYKWPTRKTSNPPRMTPARIQISRHQYKAPSIEALKVPNVLQTQSQGLQQYKGLQVSDIVASNGYSNPLLPLQQFQY